MTTVAPTLGQLERVDVRTQWKDEARDFTPWLAQEENLELLSDALGIDLTLESMEEAVGPYSADVVCTTVDGHRLIIENQFERTDHDHLGKVLTYAAGLEDVKHVIWIAERFTEQHRAALDWLNSVTDDSASFFGVELELWRIGESLPAPKFNLISKPNDWTREARVASQRRSLSEIQQMQLDYWIQFVDHLSASGSSLRMQKPMPHHHLGTSIGRSGFHLSANATVWDDQVRTSGLNRVELVIDDRVNAKIYFAQLVQDAEEIERALGCDLTWNNPENANMCRISARRSVDLWNREEWSEPVRMAPNHARTLPRCLCPPREGPRC